MADSSYVQSLFGGVAEDVKKAAVAAFRYVLDNLKLGPFNEGRRALNFQWYWFSGTTAANAGDEFSIAHGMGRIPMVVLPVLPLDQVGSQIVPLRVSRAADVNRMYFTSSSTSAAFAVLVE